MYINYKIMYGKEQKLNTILKTKLHEIIPQFNNSLLKIKSKIFTLYFKSY